MSPAIRAKRSHPAPFPRYVLARLELYVRAEARRLGRPAEVLDSFAGIGRIHDLKRRIAVTTGVELEPEWAACRAGTIVGDATALPEEWTGRFDIWATSPCLDQGHRLLTADLRWVAAGDLTEGDEVMAFDESGNPTARGTAARRHWRRAEILRSVPRSVECLRVILANGDEIVTTPEHPWLADRYAYGGHGAEWVQTKDLMGSPPHQIGRGAGRGWQRGGRQPHHVHLQVQPWAERRSFDAGWLSGMFDGEGSLSLGAHGSPKMMMCQVDGPVLDRAERLMAEFGYEPNRIARTGVPEHRAKISNLYVTGGFPGIMRALGELRPTRLLAKWDALDVTTRTVQAEKVAVLGVEPAGWRDIQEIETTAGTYIGEGYLHHNCYGNRLADHHEAKDSCAVCQGTGSTWNVDGCGDAPFVCPACHSIACACGVLAKEMKAHNNRCRACRGRLCSACGGTGVSRRYTYRHALGRMPSEGSGAVLNWTDQGGKYRGVNGRAIEEARRCLADGGLALVNVKNHMRRDQEQPVVEWWAGRMGESGFEVGEIVPLPAPGLQHAGSNAEERVDFERIIVARAT